MELIDGLNMPRGLTDDTAEICRAEKFDEKHFGNVIGIVLYKVFKSSLTTPIGNGGLCVFGHFHNFFRGNYVLIIG